MTDETAEMCELDEMSIGDVPDELPEEMSDEMREQNAAKLLEAVGDFVESLQSISEARGLDDPDDFERACNAIINMQNIAFDALRRHGFEPRGKPV
jgi:DNA-binding MurR/RpiR family transcriptional regulator